MANPRILVFAGSIRAGSLNQKLAMAVVKELALLDAAVTHVSLADYPMPIYDGDLEAQSGPPENAQKLQRLMGEHHGIFIASPEYNAGVTPLLKNTIDWVSRCKVPPNPYKDRVFAIGGASPGGLGAYRGLMMLRQSLTLGLGATVLPEQIAVSRASDAFGENGALKDETQAKQLRSLLTRLLDEASRYAR